MCVCVVIAVVAWRLQWTWESRVAQCELEHVSCVRNNWVTQPTCHAWHAKCLQTLANDCHDCFVVGAGSFLFTIVCWGIHFLGPYHKWMQLVAILSFQLYRAVKCEDNPYILAIEVLMLAYKQLLGQNSSIAPLA